MTMTSPHSLSRHKRWALIGAIAAFVILAVGMILPAMRNSYEDFDLSYCVKCGKIKRFDQFVNMHTGKTEWQHETLEQSPLSAWYEQHFRPSCDHQWRSLDAGRTGWFCLFGRRLWSSGASSASSPEPPLIRLDEEDRNKLDTLFQENPRKCREHIQATLTAGM